MTTQSDFRRRLVGLGIAGLAALSLPALAQLERRLRRIGFHSSGSSQSTSGWVDEFRKGMAALGWVDGRDYVLDARYASAVPDAVERIAAELVATQPDLLLASGDTSARALAKRTKAIPIVFTISADPVGLGLAASLQRPGGNVTGLTTLAPDLTAKQLQLLHEALPRIVHAGVLFDPGRAIGKSQVKDFEQAAARLKMRIAPLEIRRGADIEPAFKRGAELKIEAYAVAFGALSNVHSQAIADGVRRSKLPSIAWSSAMAEAGHLMSYSPSYADNFRRAAAYVDKILKGAKPGDLAIEQPTKFELVVNLKTARTLGIMIPQSILVRADRVIE